MDPERAADGPFGGTIAHGLLTLSLLPHFQFELIRVDNISMRAWTVIPAVTVLGLGFAVPAEAAPATVKYSLSAIGIGNADFTVQFQDGGQLREESGHTFAGYYWERTVKLDGARPILRVTPAGPPSVFRMSCHITVNDGIPVTNGLLFRAGDYTPQDC